MFFEIHGPFYDVVLPTRGCFYCQKEWGWALVPPRKIQASWRGGGSNSAPGKGAKNPNTSSYAHCTHTFTARPMDHLLSKAFREKREADRAWGAFAPSEDGNFSDTKKRNVMNTDDSRGGSLYWITSETKVHEEGRFSVRRIAFFPPA